MELPTNNSQPSQVKVNTPKVSYQNQPQKQSPNPYQFQQRLPIHQGSLAARHQMQAHAPNDLTNSRIMNQHMNRLPPRYPFPPNPMFDMRLPGMYGQPGRFSPFFPQGNGIPNGPPYPAGFPNVSVMNSVPHMNPLAQYYMENANSPVGTNLTRAAPPPQPPVMNQSMNGFDPNKRSPGAQSMTPSPRSRHASGSRPPSWSRPPSTSRPPSETPLSQRTLLYHHSQNGQFPNQTIPTSSQIPQFPFPPGQTIPHLQGMVQGLQPIMGPRNSTPPVSSAKSINSNIPVAHQNVHRGAQGQKMNGHVIPGERPNQPVHNVGVPQSLRSPNSANQVVSELSVNRTGPVPVELNLSQPKPSEKPNSRSAPPPLLRMANPKPADIVSPVGHVSITVPVTSNSPPVKAFSSVIIYVPSQKCTGFEYSIRQF